MKYIKLFEDIDNPLEDAWGIEKLDIEDSFMDIIDMMYNIKITYLYFPIIHNNVSIMPIIPLRYYPERYKGSGKEFQSGKKSIEVIISIKDENNDTYHRDALENIDIYTAERRMKSFGYKIESQKFYKSRTSLINSTNLKINFEKI